MSLLNSYLRSRIKAITVCIAVICFFSASYLLFDMPRLMIAAGGCVLVCGALYAFIYRLTSNAYYRIVS